MLDKLWRPLLLATRILSALRVANVASKPNTNVKFRDVLLEVAVDSWIVIHEAVVACKHPVPPQEIFEDANPPLVLTDFLNAYAYTLASDLPLGKEEPQCSIRVATCIHPPAGEEAPLK